MCVVGLGIIGPFHVVDVAEEVLPHLPAALGLLQSTGYVIMIRRSAVDAGMDPGSWDLVWSLHPRHVKGDLARAKIPWIALAPDRVDDIGSHLVSPIRGAGHLRKG